MAWFSENLRGYVRDLDEPERSLSPSEIEESKEASVVAQQISALLVQSRQSPTNETFVEELEGIVLSFGTSAVEDRFDEFYTRELLEQVPGIVDRTLTLSKLVVKNLPSEVVSAYSSEAARCYIFGFWSACVALCRAALEAALTECLRGRFFHTPGSDLKDLITAAGKFKVLDAHAETCAQAVRGLGNQVLHPRSLPGPIGREAGIHALSSLRGVLLHVYGGSPA
jgi:hypothetical protein